MNSDLHILGAALWSSHGLSWARSEICIEFDLHHFNCSERLLKSHNVFLVPVVAACNQLLLKIVWKLFENVEWSNSLLRHFKIQTLLKINCSVAAISAFGVTQHSQIFSLFLRNRIQCIALYQLHNSQALLNLRRGYCTWNHTIQANLS